MIENKMLITKINILPKDLKIKIVNYIPVKKNKRNKFLQFLINKFLSVSHNGWEIIFSLSLIIIVGGYLLIILSNNKD